MTMIHSRTVYFHQDLDDFLKKEAIANDVAIATVIEQYVQLGIKSASVQVHSMETLISMVRKASVRGDLFMPDRSLYAISSAATSEMGEVAEEVAIAMGESYKQEGPDGVVGESLDAIVALLDLIYKVNPDLTEEDLVKIAIPKCEKWISKMIELSAKRNKDRG